MSLFDINPKPNGTLTSFDPMSVSQPSSPTANRFDIKQLPLVGDIVKTVPRRIQAFKQGGIKGAVKQLGQDFLKESPESLAMSFGPAGMLKVEQKAVTEVADTALSKLISAIKSAKPARKELEQIYSAERSKRAGAVAGIFEKGQGEKSYFQALGKLKGPLAPKKPAFETVRGEGKLLQGEVDELFKKIQQHPDLDVYEKVSASTGLRNLLEGTIPPKGELRLLENTFGSDLIKTVMSKRSLGEKFGELVVDIANIPRSLITSFDMSAPLRQGVIFTVTKPSSAAKAGKEMFRQVFSQKNFDNWLVNLKKEPIYKFAKEAKLYIAEPGKIAGGLAEKEERFMTNIAQKIPVLGAITRASERAYVGYLNKLRIDVFKNLSNKFIKEGLDPKTDIKVFQELANFINNATGRGSLPQALERGSQVWSNVFFSPRLIASRANMLNPVWYIKQSPKVRREAIKSFAEFIGVGASVLALAKASGASVELDPRSTDFGKIRIGNTRWDIWGGFQQWARVFSQLASGERKTAKGELLPLSAKKYPFETRKDVAEKFFAGKLAPIPRLAYELLLGQKMFGDALTLSGEAIENSVPLYLQDMKDAFKQLGPEALFTIGFPGFFGVGVQSYLEKQKTPQGNRFNF